MNRRRNASPASLAGQRNGPPSDDRLPSVNSDCPNDDRIYAPDEIEFMLRMDRYKREHHRPFPTWQEVLLVVKGLGYRKPSDAAA